MAETDELMNSEENQGFLSQFFERFLPCQFSYVTHGGPTKMSAECSIIERHKIIKIVSKLFKIVQIAKLGFIFWFMGLGQFSECGLVYCLF